MKYAQIREGMKLHLVNDYGDLGLGATLCGISPQFYRLTVNVPMGNACRNCMRIYNAHSKRVTMMHGNGKLSFMLKHFQMMKQFFKINKSDAEFIKEMKNDGFSLIKIEGEL